jgi:hypothetical protein
MYRRSSDDPAADRVRITATTAGSREAATAATMVTYGYCSRYYTGDGEPELPPEEAIPHTRAYTLVATIRVGDNDAVIGTLQTAIGRTVPALTLFGRTPGTRLPHCNAASDGSELVGELRRFGVNPILKAVDAPDDPLNAMLRDWRSMICRGLYQHSVDLFRAMHVPVVYGIATPKTYRFLTRSSMRMRRLESAVLLDSPETRALRNHFARYWRAQQPQEQQPALYQILAN